MNKCIGPIAIVRIVLSVLCLTYFPGCGSAEEPIAPDTETIVLEEPQKQQQAANDSMLTDARQIIQSGDLILRCGRDYASEFIRDLNLQDKTWSHGGIAVVDSGKIMVYHIEPDNHHIHDKVRKEPLDTFCRSSTNKSFGVARYKLSPAEKEVFLQYLDAQYQQQVVFDMRFMLNTNDSMYCSEMIKKGLAKATHHKIDIEPGRIRDSNKFKILRTFFKISDKVITSRDIIFIDQLFLHPYCTVLKRYQYFE